jgi:hypothetical protein
MIDQFTSHGMLGVTLRCGVMGTAAGDAAPGANGKRGAAEAPTTFFEPLKDYATVRPRLGRVRCQ